MKPQPLRQSHIDWLLSYGVTIEAMIHPEAMLARGGTFYFPDDDAFWEPKASGRQLTGHFCLGADNILDADQYSFDGALHVYETPMAWLKSNRNGIVVIDWSQIFHQLQDAPRVSVPKSLMPLYKKWMRPPRMPEVRFAA